MMKSPAHKGFLKTSDFLLIVSLSLGSMLEYLFPTIFPIARTVTMGAGVGIVILGWMLIFITKYELKKSSQPSKPGVPTTKLITSGIFQYSRNPIYIGMILINIGIGIFADSIWITGSTVILIGLISYFLIIPEEKYLTDAFGEEFQEYNAKVKRWF